MKKLIISVMTVLLLALCFSGCATSRKNQSELKGLMLLDNLQLSRNKAFYSKHNTRTRNDAYRRFKRNSRHI